ncbi:hypothetical protein BGY98DRAFT_1103099 [Russula aff. rugulosa BPL654]|nr:hypothetical protein BGY98DRAFT_1103099 [Russula aff. rugulosa BPL654]
MVTVDEPKLLPSRAFEVHSFRPTALRAGPAPGNITQHTSFVAQHPVTLRALSLTTLDSFPGAKTESTSNMTSKPFPH